MCEVTLNNENFKAETAAGVVVVDFWADWCSPCRMFGPIVKEVAKEVGGKAKVGKLNVDENQKIAEKFNIMSLPTILIFKDGKIMESLIGAQPAEILIEKINYYVNS